MSDYYLPWPERRSRALRGAAKAIAGGAAAVHAVAAPIVRRFPGTLFTLGVIATCLLTWLVALAMRAAWMLEAQVAADGAPAPGRMLSLSELSAALAIADIRMPALAVWPFQSPLVRDATGVAGVIGFVSLLAMFAIWWERKVSAFMQSRLGPMRVGGWHGWSQSLADGVKLMSKEDLIPDGADRPLFRLAPYIAFVPALAALMALPFGVYWVFRDLDVALLFILAMLGIEVVGVLVAGWASNNKWSVYGAMREACQVVSYEIPMGMSLLVPVMIAGTLRLSEIQQFQSGGWFHWIAFHSPWAFIALFTYFVASLASCKRAPFDLPEAESELVAGFHTEYSGFRWAVFFFAEYAGMFIVSGLLVLLFLGGWDAPWAGLAPAAWLRPDAPLGQQLVAGVLFSGPIWFILKCLFLIYVQMWLRWTLPRLRIDQVLYSCVQVILPLTMVVLLASTVWELLLQTGVPGVSAAAVQKLAGGISVVLALVGAVIAIAILAVAAAGHRGRRALVGGLAVDRPLAGG